MGRVIPLQPAPMLQVGRRRLALLLPTSSLSREACKQPGRAKRPLREMWVKTGIITNPAGSFGV